MEVSNVGLVKTLALGDRAQGVNELVIEVVESPDDRPEELFQLRRLVLPVNVSQGGTEVVFDCSTQLTVVAN